MSTSTTDEPRSTSTTTDEPRAGARTPARTDLWTDETRDFTTDDAPFTFDPGLRSRVPNGCDAENQSTPR